ncbi:MAG: alpha/beta hydrolase [Gemmatimonadetes bacterium]|nr:alpha/beta hydrolase [Gemmatimonadota bacterium]
MIALALWAALALAPATRVVPAAAAHRPPGVRADTTFDTVFVVTNRRRTPSDFAREATDSLWYGIYVARLVVSPSRNPRPLAPMRVTRADSAALDEAEWRTRLALAVRDTTARRAALIYVHGYSSSPATALAQGMQVKARGGHDGPLVLFLWPTHELYVVPTPMKVYRDDARAAARSAPAFARVMRMVDSTAGGAVLVAHSMGSRVALGGIIDDADTHAYLVAHPLRAIGIFSPDVSATTFSESYAPHLPDIAYRVALYGASRDYVLGAAALLNRERRAAGLVTRTGQSIHGIERVDETRGARAEPFLLNVAGPGHAVRWASAALADFFGVVVANADPECRARVGTADAEGDGRWRLRRGVLASDSLMAMCRPPDGPR